MGEGILPTTNAVMTRLEQLLRIYHAQGFAHGMTPAQWQALRYFDRAEGGDRTLTGFAQARATSMGTASTTVSWLVNRGLLERAHGGARNVALRLTAEGQNLLESKDPYRCIERAVDALPTVQRKALVEAADSIVAATDSGSS